MEPIVDHFEEYYRWYALAAICLLPLIVIFRRQTFPAILYAVELAIYAAIMHCLVHVVAIIAAWFKDQSTMKRARDLLDADYNPGWTTPLLEFWNRKEYNPEWLIFFEVGLLALVFFLMWRYRPMQKRKPKKKAPAKKTGKGYDYRKAR